MPSRTAEELHGRSEASHGSRGFAEDLEPVFGEPNDLSGVDQAVGHGGSPERR